MSVGTIAICPRGLSDLGPFNPNNIHYQLEPDTLIRQTLQMQEGQLNHTGALVIKTGDFTGRSPKDKFIVRDAITETTVDWNNFNIPISENHYQVIFNKITDYLAAKPAVWVRDAFACADPRYKINISVVNEKPWGDLFSYNMFIRPTQAELEEFKPEWKIYVAPGLKLNPASCGTRQENAAVISFTHKTILIAGTGYTGEIKKGVFTILNYILPQNKQVLSMHCAANMGKTGDTAVFFGLSGTGKTTLSADPARKLIGDDEHGWTEDGIFNFEGGCYAKTIDLSEEKEPEIFQAIRKGALVENTSFLPESNIINFSCNAITENTRVSYPLSFISNAANPSIAGIPKNIFFLTCDAYGILPPISKLNPQQAMYQFISGYTARVAGTETGVKEPTATFSACFGAPFLPLHPGKYAALLGEKINKHHVNVWLINTGWTGGAYGQGSRIKLQYTRAMIQAVLTGLLRKASFETDPIFGFQIPLACPGVPTALMKPKNTWTNKFTYEQKARELAQLFIKNFEKYANGVDASIRNAAPKI